MGGGQVGQISRRGSLWRMGMVCLGRVQSSISSMRSCSLPRLLLCGYSACSHWLPWLHNPIFGPPSCGKKAAVRSSIRSCSCSEILDQITASTPPSTLSSSGHAPCWMPCMDEEGRRAPQETASSPMRSSRPKSLAVVHRGQVRAPHGGGQIFT